MENENILRDIMTVKDNKTEKKWNLSNARKDNKDLSFGIEK